MGGHSDDLRQIVAETTKSIDRYESALTKLLARRAKAQLELDSIVYPVLTLPPEITSEIFLYCLPTSHMDLERNSPNPNEAPILLSHVCRTWKEIAIGTPALWTTIDLEIGEMESADILKMWLHHARALPLSVRLGIKEDADEDAIGGIFGTFAEHSRRMQSLELEICVEHLQDLEKAHGHWSFPLLRTLSICVSDGDDHDFTVDIEIFTNSPLLREVSLSKTPTSSFSLPWHQLSKFTGTAYTIDDCLEVLDLIPNLTECAFAAHSVYDAPASRQVTHSNLQSLTLFNDSEVDRSACSADILAYLSLPALQTLEVIDSEADDFDEIFDGFLSRSSPPLRKFTIRLAYATRFYTTSFLHMPKLVDLEIWNPTASFVSDFFDYFDDWDTTFLPELQHLAFLGCRTVMPEIYDMLELLQPSLAGRWRARNRTEFAKMESFRLIWPNWIALNVTEDALRPFQRLIAEGLDVCIEREPN